MCVLTTGTVVAGIDVGCPRKGFHAVAMRDCGYLAKFAVRDVLAVTDWCLDIGAQIIAIDAPCRWSRTGRASPAERALAGEGNAATGPVCCETFPQAVACAIAGMVVSARGKGVVRRALLREVGIASAPLANIDLVDAALCALAAEALLAGRFQTYGDVGEGFIVVPAWRPCPRAAAGPAEGAGMGPG